MHFLRGLRFHLCLSLILLLHTVLPVSCTSSRNTADRQGCISQLYTTGYQKTGDSFYIREEKQVGRTYFNFRVDSCVRLGNESVRIIGQVTFTDIIAGNERGMPEVEITQVMKSERQTFRKLRYLGTTEASGRFTLTMPHREAGVYLLLDKSNFTYTMVSFTW